MIGRHARIPGPPGPDGRGIDGGPGGPDRGSHGAGSVPPGEEGIVGFAFDTDCGGAGLGVAGIKVGISPDACVSALEGTEPCIKDILPLKAALEKEDVAVITGPCPMEPFLLRVANGKDRETESGFAVPPTPRDGRGF